MDFILVERSSIGAAKRKSIVWTVGRGAVGAGVYPSKLKLAAIDPSVGEELSRYSKEFREIYFR